jgi:hypothetical protein
MRPWLMLRAVVWLKRGALALERIAKAQETLATPQRKKQPRMAEVFSPTTELQNEIWREEHPYDED